jgi:hypothetical protein
VLPLHLHRLCAFFVLRRCRQVSHWETGRPLRLTSNSGRSLCPQWEERCPLMQASLEQRGDKVVAFTKAY